MIYIIDDTTEQEVYIPSASGKQTGTLTFALYSTVNRETPYSATVTDMADTDIYYHIAITLTEGLQHGEYEYTLKKGNALLACGLAHIGDEEQHTEYNNTIEYEQYEAE